MQAQEVCLKVLCVLDPRPLIDTWSSGLPQSEEACPQDLNVDVMQERRQLVLSVPGAASRMRACARDTASRLCVRTVLCSSAFSLAPPLRSTGSAGPSRQRPGHDWRDGDGDLPVPAQKVFCACQGLRRRGVGMFLAISTPAVLPSVGRKTSAPRTCLTPLNTSPAPSPVNASRLPSRTTRASLGAGTVRYSLTVTVFHRLPFAGLPAHPSIHGNFPLDLSSLSQRRYSILWNLAEGT
jgi:hypothetical protein